MGLFLPARDMRAGRPVYESRLLAAGGWRSLFRLGWDDACRRHQLRIFRLGSIVIVGTRLARLGGDEVMGCGELLFLGHDVVQVIETRGLAWG